MKNNKYTVGAYLCHCMTITLLEIIKIYILESDI